MQLTVKSAYANLIPKDRVRLRVKVSFRIKDRVRV